MTFMSEVSTRVHGCGLLLMNARCDIVPACCLLSIQVMKDVNVELICCLRSLSIFLTLLVM